MFGRRATGALLRSASVRAGALGGAASIAALSLNSNKAHCSNSAGRDTSSSLPQIYQYKICPFCHRAKVYLDYLKVQYETVEVNPITKSELGFSPDYRKVPIARIDGNIIKGSDEIVDYITKHIGGEKAAALRSEDCKKWEDWSANKLAITIYPNITRNLEESWECFEYARGVESWSPALRWAVQVVGPVAMLFSSGKIKKKYGIEDERKALKDALEEWTSAVKGPFLHGSQVTLPDLMVYGVLRSVKGFRTWREVMEGNCKLKEWYDNMELQVVSHEVCAINDPK